MARRRQLATALLVVSAALAVLLAAGQAARLPADASQAKLPVLTGGSGAKPPLSSHEFAVWSDADGRFVTAARVFATALGGCRMRLGSFHACVTAAVGEMAFEEHNAAGAAAAYDSRPGPCGRALHIYRSEIAHYLSRAIALAGHPLSELHHMQARLLLAAKRFDQVAEEVRLFCRPS